MSEGFKGERTKKSLEASRIMTNYQKQYYRRMTESTASSMNTPTPAGC